MLVATSRYHQYQRSPEHQYYQASKYYRCARSKTEKEKIAKHGSLTHVCNFFTPVTFLQIYTTDPGLCFLPTSCAAVMWNYLSLLVLSGSLASAASTGRRVPPRLVLMARLPLALTTSTLMLLVCTRRMARTSAGSVSPSAALVLY